MTDTQQGDRVSPEVSQRVEDAKARQQELENRFQHHPPDRKKIMLHQSIRTRCFHLAQELVIAVPDGREQSVALRKLEECMMWANAGIARKL